MSSSVLVPSGTIEKTLELVSELRERNAKLVAALRIAEIELTAHENDRATDNSVSPELKMIRDILNRSEKT